MSRIPAGLLYLTIYNPTLQPATQPSAEDDEDAEEQAHILFYTARERAVSRDRMLRQVGLAKALVNFSAMFNADDLCENVHSQTRRMIMLSPEPNYWIHACFEVARTPRIIQTRHKGKEKGKGKGKEKAADKENTARQEATYDYHDGSINDLALHAHILRGYEQFKLTHGTFDFVLSSLGQHALELQLERFFTVWAWKWDVEEDSDFSSFLGVPLHQFHSTLTPMVDELASSMPENTCPFVLSAPYVIPSSTFASLRYPPSLIRYIISRIPPNPSIPGIPALPIPGNRPAALSDIPTPNGTSDDSTLGKKPSPNLPSSPSSNFLALPNVNLDVRQFKWNWPGYLSFGKQSLSKPSVATSVPAVAEAESNTTALDIGESGAKALNIVPLDVDSESLQDAMSSDAAAASSTRAASPASSLKPSDQVRPPPQEYTADDEERPEMLPIDSSAGEADDFLPNASSNGEATGRLASATDGGTPSSLSSASPSPEPEVPEPDKILPSFLSSTVYLPTQHGLDIEKKRVWHFTTDTLTFVLVTKSGHDYSADLIPMTRQICDVLANIQRSMEREQKQMDESNVIPTANKILQPEDKHIVSTGNFTTGSSSVFTSKSEHLFYGEQLLQSELDVTEVFSRGLNPQHWHVAKRGLGSDDEGHAVDGRVYLEVARKESSLNDVDNELGSVVRRFMTSL